MAAGVRSASGTVESAPGERHRRPLTTSDFDFALPPERIALRPARPRDSARMLVVPAGVAAFVDTGVRDLPRFLRRGDILVVNDTRVIPARLSGTRRRGDSVARIELTLHKPLGEARWRAFAKPAKRLRVGDRILLDEASGTIATVEALSGGGEATVRITATCGAPDIDALGQMPLPPYIAGRRPVDADDRRDYQTVYARVRGSVAAPTAGLHFTDALFARLEAAGVERAAVTLHVGAGTFLPVKTEQIAAHTMHAERGIVTDEVAAAINAVRARGGRIVAVGTTVLRLLESAAGEDGQVRPFDGETEIFITPGYRFRAVDVLMTNFHLPRSTLFMLVSAFCGLERMRAAYAHAIANEYRFYSYGDACLLVRADGA